MASGFTRIKQLLSDPTVDLVRNCRLLGPISYERAEALARDGTSVSEWEFFGDYGPILRQYSFAAW